MADRTCSVDGCPSQRWSSRWCRKHYYRWVNTGDPEGLKRYPFPENLLRRLTVGPSGCVIFTGANSHGYGKVAVGGGRMVYAHRAMYELMVGPIPSGHVLDHLCRNRACVNPGHLEPVTHRENILRGNGASARNAVKTHCPEGHEYDARNADGSRKCSICERARSAARRPRRTHCRNGHEYTEGNTWIDGHGWRRCRSCAKALYARQYEAKKAKLAATSG